MIQKKICMLGGFAVGKTSLVSRFVSSIFSDAYLTTVGVKISKKPLDVAGDETDLIIWDIYGEDEFQKMRASYLKGASGYFLVADVTRAATLDTAVSLQRLAQQTIGSVPFMLLLNKSDLGDKYALDRDVIKQLDALNWPMISTSAKTGDFVEKAFVDLARKMAR